MSSQETPPDTDKEQVYVDPAEPRVTLICYTGQWMPAKFPKALIHFLRKSRLELSPGELEKSMAEPEEVLMESVKAAAKTIPSCWEFIDYTFMIEDVSRAFTHQFVRTRNASYQQQTMRVLEMSEPRHAYPDLPEHEKKLFQELAYSMSVREAHRAYNSLIRMGMPIEDARGILPTNIATNICAKMSLRTLAELVVKRLQSGRVQGEYRTVLTMMRDTVLEVHPWAEHFLCTTEGDTAMQIEEHVRSLDISKEERAEMFRLVDKLRTQS